MDEPSWAVVAFAVLGVPLLYTGLLFFASRPSFALSDIADFMQPCAFMIGVVSGVIAISFVQIAPVWLKVFAMGCYAFTISGVLIFASVLFSLWSRDGL